MVKPLIVIGLFAFHLSFAPGFRGPFGHLLADALFERLLDAHLLHVLGADLHLFVDSVIVSFHDILDRHCARNNVPEAAHPHISIFHCFSTKDIQAISRLEI